MNKIIAAGSFAIAILAGAGTAYAGSIVGQGIPVMPNQPLVSLSSPVVVGEAYPAFGTPATPVISAQTSARVAGEAYPNFIAPQHATRYAQTQIGAVED